MVFEKRINILSIIPGNLCYWFSINQYTAFISFNVRAGIFCGIDYLLQDPEYRDNL